MGTVISEHSDCISHPNTQHIMYMYVYIYRYICIYESLLSNYQIAQCVIADGGNESSYRYDPTQLISWAHGLITGNVSVLRGGTVIL